MKTIDDINYYSEEELENLFEEKSEKMEEEFKDSYYLEIVVDGETYYGKE